MGSPLSVCATPSSAFVADFVGADRGLKRLSVTAIDLADLETPPVVREDDDLASARQKMRASDARWAIVVDEQGALRGWIGLDSTDAVGKVKERSHRMQAWVPLGASLKQAFSEMLQHDAGWVAVLNVDRFVGVLTPESLHAALRRSVDAAEGIPLAASPIRD